MHPQFTELTPRWFKRAFIYTGSIGEFRYRFNNDAKENVHHARCLLPTVLRAGCGCGGAGFSLGRRRRGGAEGVAPEPLRGVLRRQRLMLIS